MHPCAAPALLLILMAAAFAIPTAATSTPAAARFWEHSLPGSPMPDSIAQLVQNGIDHSPLKERERYAAPAYIQPSAICLSYRINCGGGRGPPGLFFHEAEIIHTGAAMTVSFPPASTRPILPLNVSDNNAPFADAAAVLTTFAIPPRSDAAARVRDTLRRCRAPPLAGESKACATSLESTVRAATRMLVMASAGGGTVWAAASAVPRDGVPRREYEVTAVTALDGDRHVACHDEPFPYAVFQCHVASTTTKAYMVRLGGGGREVAMAALCHRDTSNWNPAHPAFEVLKTKPGGAPVCHFMPYANLVFGVKA